MKTYKVSLISKNNQALFSQEIEAESVKIAKDIFKPIAFSFSPGFMKHGFIGVKRIR